MARGVEAPAKRPGQARRDGSDQLPAEDSRHGQDPRRPDCEPDDALIGSDEADDAADENSSRWLTVTAASERALSDPPLHPRTVYAQVAAVTLLVVLMVAVSGVFAVRQEAEQQAVLAAAQRTDTLAVAVIEPALLDGIVDQDPRAVAQLEQAVKAHVIGNWISRVKFWTDQGLIVYSNDARVSGKRFPISKELRRVLAKPQLRAEVTDLSEPENTFERAEGKLLEVYRPVWTPGGHMLVMETYAPYRAVDERAGHVWRDFAMITISSLLVLVMLLLPVLWRLIQRLHRSQVQREALLERAVNASEEERHRIAATLHDGVVQELAGASFVVSGAAARAEAEGRQLAAEDLRGAATTVRTSIGGLRTLLVDIYPPSLAATGIQAALADLVASLRNRHVAVRLDTDDPCVGGLSKEGARLIFRVAQECLRNAARHSQASAVDVRLAADSGAMVLDVIDNGIGFDAQAFFQEPPDGHFGLRLMADAAAHGNALLRVSSAPGAGTHWQLQVPMAKKPVEDARQR